MQNDREAAAAAEETPGTEPPVTFTDLPAVHNSEGSSVALMEQDGCMPCYALLPSTGCHWGKYRYKNTEPVSIRLLPPDEDNPQADCLQPEQLLIMLADYYRRQLPGNIGSQIIENLEYCLVLSADRVSDRIERGVMGTNLA